jgi:hypothetical protein
MVEDALPATEVPEYVEKYRDLGRPDQLRPGWIREGLLGGAPGDPTRGQA